MVDVHKSFGTQKVLDGVNLTIEEGLLTVIMGRSGEGKSVLLKHMVGLLKPDKGEIWVNGTEISGLKDKEMNIMRERFGMLFQSAALFDSMDVKDNVAFPLREHTKLSEKEIDRIVNERLTQVGMEGFGEKTPGELSGGMKKRVGLARALVRDPAIVLFDEPTTGLDPIIALAVQQMVKETQVRLKKTYVVITHDLAVTFRIADRVAVLAEGKVLEYGTPDDIRRSVNEFTKEFLEAATIPGLSGGIS